MPKKGSKAPRKVIGDASDPMSLYNQMLQYLGHMAVRHYSQNTVRTWDRYLQLFLRWCEERSLTKVQEIDTATLERYQRHLFYWRKADGQPLSVASQHIRIIPIRQWFKWLTKLRRVPHNPAADLELPKRGIRLPKAILTAKEAEAVIAMPDVNTVFGLRDRAILETFYSTGMRRAELVRLTLQDLDFERGVVLVRDAKNGNDRIISIGERALAWICAYCERARPRLVMGKDDGTLFLTNLKLGFSEVRMSHLVGEYVKRAGISKAGSCHMFRHTMATLMLENGADIRVIQVQLGHEQISSSQVYTRVSVKHLKQVHTSTHPGKMPVANSHQEEVDPETSKDSLPLPNQTEG